MPLARWRLQGATCMSFGPRDSSCIEFWLLQPALQVQTSDGNIALYLELGCTAEIWIIRTLLMAAPLC